MRVHAFLVIVSFIQPLYLCVPLASYSIDGRYLIAIVVVVETVVAGKIIQSFGPTRGPFFGCALAKQCGIFWLADSLVCQLFFDAYWSGN